MGSTLLHGGTVLTVDSADRVIEDGWIGTPLWAQANYSRNSIYGEWNYEIDEGATAEDVGWEAFLGHWSRHLRMRRQMPSGLGMPFEGGVCITGHPNKIFPQCFR